MQTRRDQLQAYRFQNRRALAALVTGQPNVLEPPMRRLTVTTLSGITIAILIAVVFAVIAIIDPSAGTRWKNDTQVIVDTDNSSTYVYLGGQLHPVLNYTSAVLAVGKTAAVGKINVSSSDIDGANYGYEIGIPGVPNSLPGQGSLINYPISVCSVQQDRKKAGGAVAKVTVHIGSTGAKTAVPADDGVLVTAPRNASTYLLYDGQRLEVGSAQIGSVLNLSAQPVTVGTAFLDSVPQGPALAPPPIPGARTELTGYRIAGQHIPIASVVHVQGTNRAYLAMQDGLFALSPVETALFTGYPHRTTTLTDATSNTAPTDTEDLSSLDLLPSTVPTVDPDTAQRAGVCTVYDNATDNPHLVLPARKLSTFNTSPAGQSNLSRAGRADTVDLPPTKGLLATPLHDSTTATIVTDQGIRYAFDAPGTLGVFGYSASDVVKVPSAVLSLIPPGPAVLSHTAALQRVNPLLPNPVATP